MVTSQRSMDDAMSVQSPTLSVVVPVYNAEKNLELLERRLRPILDDRAGELILVSDASPDGSWQIIRSLSRSRPRVRGLRLMRNSGQHAALLAGIRSARGSVV